MWAALFLGLGIANAAELEHTLSWNLSVGGHKIGHRDVTVKYVNGDMGMRRILESWTEIDGTVGPIRVLYRQRMTAHVGEREPASFHAVMEQNGSAQEVQARWTASTWWVTNSANGRNHTTEVPANRIDISTADLMDPESRFPLSQYQTVRILSAETGDVLLGEVGDLGSKELNVAGKMLQVHGYSWDSPEGKSTFWFSADGWLVNYNIALMGVQLSAELAAPPPPGIDEFVVGYGRPSIEEIPL